MLFLRRRVFKICGLFDEQYEGMRMGDAEFGLRAFQERYNINIKS